MERPAKRRRLRSFPVFSTLPDEIALQIFKKLDVVSQLRLRKACRKWNSLMHDRSVLETVKLVEKDYIICRETGRYDRFELLMRNLCQAGVWRHVEHIIIEGDYDPSSQEFHSGVRPYTVSKNFSTLLEAIEEAKRRKVGDFVDLETIFVRNGAVELHEFCNLVDKAALRCRLTISDGSLVFTDYTESPFGVEFPINGSKAFQLSGEMVQLTDGPRLSFSKYSRLVDNMDIVPLEIAQFMTAECDKVSDEMVAKLGELYSVLLKGRKGMLLRDDIYSLFLDVLTNDAHYDSSKKHWEQCKQYDFGTLNALVKYALVYYSRPWTCFRTLPKRCGYTGEAHGI